MTRVVVGGDDLLGFEFAPGQDLMLAVPTDATTVDGGTINRRYTIRRADPAAGTVDLDLVVHGDAPGARWASDAQLGSSIAAVGPRGKVLPAAAVDWHLFVCDESGWAATAVMVESLTSGDRAVVVADIAGEDEQQPLEAVADVYVSWCNRDGTPHPVRSEQGPRRAREHLTLPDGRGHAYLSAEFAVVRSVSDWLTAHGFASDDIAPKSTEARRAAERATRRAPPRRLSVSSRRPRKKGRH